MAPSAQPGTFIRLSKRGGIYKPTTAAEITAANDTFWSAKGDLAVGTGNDAAAVLTVTTTPGQTLVKDSVASTGLAWATDWWASRMPSGAISETRPRLFMEHYTTTLTTQRLYLTAIFLPKDATITSISFVSAGTAAGTPTNWWFALYDSSRNFLRQTADQTSTAWAANTTKTVNLTSTYTTTTAGLFYIGIMMKATTPINLYSVGGTAMHGIAPILGGLTSDTGLTDTAPGNPGGTAGAITNGAALYGWVS